MLVLSCFVCFLAGIEQHDANCNSVLNLKVKHECGGEKKTYLFWDPRLSVGEVGGSPV